MNARLTDIRAMLAERIAPHWHALSPGGRRVIGLTGSLLVVGLLWALIVQPLQTSRTKNLVGIQHLHRQLAQMKIEAEEVQQLRNIAPVAASVASAIADAPQLQSIFGAQTTVTMAAALPAGSAARATNSVSFRVDVRNMAYADLVDRIEQATSRLRLRVVSASLSRAVEAAPGTVAGDIVFADAR